jgi:glutamate formiminotransferase/formiminotetrahydrofolate cyclodeaminase
VAAHVGSLAAALAQMVAGLTVGRKKYAAVEGEFREVAQQAVVLGQRLTSLVELDAAAYTAVSNAYKLPKDTPEQITQRDAAITTALIGASEVPLETARACADVAALAQTAATKGNSNAVSDAGVAALLAEAACRGAAYNVRINVAALPDRAKGQALVDAANQFVRLTADRARAVTEEVEKRL